MAGNLTELDKALQALKLDAKKSNSGDYYTLHCPYAKRHKRGVDNHPSFVINPRKNYARCFTCHFNMEVFDFLTQYGSDTNNIIDFEYLEFYIPSLVDEVIDEENIELDESILQVFTTRQDEISKYLAGRNINIDNIEPKLYYDWGEKRVVLPIRNEYNYLVGATSRAINQNPLKSYHYFGVRTGVALAGFERRDKRAILIVEGMTDILNAYDKIHQTGLDFDVYSPLTCSLSTWQAQKLVDECRPIFMAFDMDKAGRTGQYKALSLLKDLGVDVVVSLSWKDRNKDVGDWDCDMFKKLLD